MIDLALTIEQQINGVNDYIKIGVIPEAFRNYLLRLGWSYKDKEIFSKQESIDLFDLNGVGKSPSKLDINRIYSINETYIKTIDEKDLFNFVLNVQVVTHFT